MVFEALDGPLGLVLPPSWADLVPKWSPKWTPKVVQEAPQKVSQKQVPVEPYFLRVPGLFLGLGNGPRWDSDAFWIPKPGVLCQPPGVIFRFESGSLFGNNFLEVLGVFRGLLGTLLGFPRLSWEASGTSSNTKISGSQGFLDVFLGGFLSKTGRHCYVI